jgi:hypothetical protein
MTRDDGIRVLIKRRSCRLLSCAAATVVFLFAIFSTPVRAQDASPPQPSTVPSNVDLVTVMDWLRLGDNYAQGKGVPRDGAKARYWYERIDTAYREQALRADAQPLDRYVVGRADDGLGDLYARGQGCPGITNRRCSGI